MAKKKVEKSEEQPIESQNIVNSPSQNSPEESAEQITVAEKLLALYDLQQICSQIDKIRIVRGELPNEVSDLEDTCAGLKTRVSNCQTEISELKKRIKETDEKIKESHQLIERYKTQQENVRNNREYESLTKELEYQGLEIQLSDKAKIRLQNDIVAKSEEIKIANDKLEEYTVILAQKKDELAGIIEDTKKEEAELEGQAERLKHNIDERLLTAFERIRTSARNGLAIVKIERAACGGCFSMIPPQRQLDIRLHKKIIVCEACGRIFIDQQLVDSRNTRNEI
ncbi:MAG: C4-type zinc ribbon domain-containing protein [Bacteroidales bacterium]|jgi:predicted  nucleic acid-binding Zn-ribbon protein|nr:C4-type zinc ribbon domain-containing protein [Bacteroidales bacterium]